jgi:hypothetical protein
VALPLETHTPSTLGHPGWCKALSGMGVAIQGQIRQLFGVHRLAVDWVGCSHQPGGSGGLSLAYMPLNGRPHPWQGPAPAMLVGPVWPGYQGHFTHEPSTVTMKLWEPKWKCLKDVPRGHSRLGYYFWVSNSLRTF